jgi:hypothetical protein
MKCTHLELSISPLAFYYCHVQDFLVKVLNEMRNSNDEVLCTDSEVFSKLLSRRRSTEFFLHISSGSLNFTNHRMN